MFAASPFAISPLGVGIESTSEGSTDPVIVDVTAGDTSAVVTYTGTATHYRLDGGASVAIGASPHTITGLTADTEYTVELTGDEITWTDAYAFGTDNSGEGGGEIPDGNITVSVPAASLSLTGFAPLVVTPRLVAVPAATLTLTGFAPSISAVGAVAIQVPVGLLSLTGYAPTISAGGGPTAISIPSGTLTLTGWAPKVSNGAPKFAEKLDEYPQFPDASDQTMRKLTDLFRRTNQRVNRITEGVVYDHYAARQAQPASDEGAWGDFVLNSRPVELGSGGSKYIIRGWRRLQNDWVPERVLTGN